MEGGTVYLALTKSCPPLVHEKLFRSMNNCEMYVNGLSYNHTGYTPFLMIEYTEQNIFVYVFVGHGLSCCANFKDYSSHTTGTAQFPLLSLLFLYQQSSMQIELRNSERNCEDCSIHSCSMSKNWWNKTRSDDAIYSDIL